MGRIEVKLPPPRGCLLVAIVKHFVDWIDHWGIRIRNDRFFSFPNLVLSV